MTATDRVDRARGSLAAGHVHERVDRRVAAVHSRVVESAATETVPALQPSANTNTTIIACNKTNIITRTQPLRTVVSGGRLTQLVPVADWQYVPESPWLAGAPTRQQQRHK